MKMDYNLKFESTAKIKLFKENNLITSNKLAL